MDTHDRIVRSRRLVKLGALIGYGTALVITVLRLVNTDPVTAGEIVGSIALGVALAAPGTLALLSLDRRPSLLPAAAVGAMAVSVVEPVLLLPVGAAVAFLWYRAWSQRPVPAEVPRKLAVARVGLGLLLAVATLVLFSHRDPACVQHLTDGTTRPVDPASRGLTSGWSVGGGTTMGSSSSAAGSDVVEEICTSDTIVLPEALASLAITGLVLEMGRRWPEGTRIGVAPGAGA